MLDLDTRTAILRLRSEGHGVRTIARALSLSRGAVRAVVRSGAASVPLVERSERLDGELERIEAFFLTCRGNLVRVHEELSAAGIAVAYPTLTAFCRRHGIGQAPRVAAGRYHFEPGEEMQHDTSPHDVEVGGRRRRLQCASLVLCSSRLLYAQVYPRFNRFWCRVFLTEALTTFGGAPRRCMVDNTSVIVAHGSGRDAVIAPEMAAFAERFGFLFRAHAVGDANRSARVERPFHYIERNFYPGRSFGDLADLNAQIRAWCERVNASFKRSLAARPIDLFAAERTCLRPLPLHVPEVYEQVVRVVDVEGYVCLHTNRYSAPVELLHHSVRVTAGKDCVRIFDGHRLVAEHVRAPDGAGERHTLPEHLRQGRFHPRPRPLSEQERTLRAQGPELTELLDGLRRRGHGLRSVLRLHRLYLDYPSQALTAAVRRALDHGLFDLERIESLVLREIAGEFFRLPDDDRDDRDADQRDDDRDADVDEVDGADDGHDPDEDA